MLLLQALLFTGLLAQAADVHVVVTAEPRHGKDAGTVAKEDVMAFQGNDRVPVANWVPLTGAHAALELYILLDDSSDTNLGIHLDEIRKFIEAQPSSTSIAIGYMRNGTVDVAQSFTADHALAGKHLRLPVGSAGINPSPYMSVSDLIKKWPDHGVRREILLISDGIDRYYEDDVLNNPYVNEAIQHAQRAGVVVFSIYARGAGHYGHSLWRVNIGQSLLSRLADETGGEAYTQGLETPVSFSPYLEDLTRRLQRQYLLTFEPKSGKKLRLRTELPNIDLVSADNVYVH